MGGGPGGRLAFGGREGLPWVAGVGCCVFVFVVVCLFWLLLCCFGCYVFFKSFRHWLVLPPSLVSLLVSVGSLFDVGICWCCCPL